MNWLEKYGITRTYLRYYFAAFVIVTVGQYAYSELVTGPRIDDALNQHWLNMSSKEYCEFISKPIEEKNKIRDEIISKARRSWFNRS